MPISATSGRARNLVLVGPSTVPMVNFANAKTQLQAALSDHTFEEQENDGKTTLELKKGWTSGLDIELEGGRASVEWSTKIGTVVILAVLGLTAVGTYVFGDGLLQAMGLIAETGDGGGFTLRLFYIIPMLIFLVPLMILSSVMRTKLAPEQPELVARAKSILTNEGYVIEEE